MRNIITKLRQELRDPEYSEGYAESFLNSYIATQIKVIREQRHMTQADLASEIGTTQAGVSRLENVNYSSWSIRTLIKLARAFELRLPGEVISFRRECLERVKRSEDMGLGGIVNTPTTREGSILEYAFDVPKSNDVTSIDSHHAFLSSVESSDRKWLQAKEA